MVAEGLLGLAAGFDEGLVAALATGAATGLGACALALAAATAPGLIITVLGLSTVQNIKISAVKNYSQNVTAVIN